MVDAPKILLVEDDKTDRQLIRITLEKGLEKVSITEVSSMRKLQDALEGDSYDFVLTDYKLKGFTGIDVLKVLREREPDVPVVMLTGMGSEDVAFNAIKEGVDDYVVKSLEHIKRLPAKIISILERKNAQKSLENLDKAVFSDAPNYEGYFENNSDPVHIVSIRGELLYTNSSWRQCLGYEDEEIAELNIFDLIAPEDQQHCEYMFARVLKGERVENVPFHLVRKNGEIIFLEGTCICQFKDGKPDSVFSSFHKKRETEVSPEDAREAAERYMGAFENSPIGIVIGNQQGKVLQLNQAACDLIGASIEEMRGVDFRDISYPDDIEASAENLRRLFSGEIESYHFEKRYIHKKGHIIWCDVTASLVRNPDGTTKFGIAQIKDITERKNAELTTKRQTEFIQLLGKIVVAANESDSVETVLQVCINEVCQYMDWPIGHASLISNDDKERFTPGKIWYLKDTERYGLFRSGTEARVLEVEICGRGNMHDLLRYVWLENLAKEAKFERKEEAEAVGLKTACVFPVLVKKNVVAMLEFFNDTISEQDDEFVELMLNVCAQVARVIERKQSEEELSLSEEKFSTAFRFSPDAMAISSMSDGILFEANDSFFALTGYTREEAINHSVIELGIWSDAVQRGKLLEELQDSGLVRNMEAGFVTKSGEVRNCQISAEMVTISSRQYMLTIARDLTEQKKAEEALARSHRALRVLNDSNHAIVHATSGQELIQEICRIIVEKGGYRFTWVGYAHFDDNKTVYPVGSAGYEAGYLDNTFTWRLQEGVFEPLSEAIRNNRPCIIKNLAIHPGRDGLQTAALERGYRSELALPLIAGEETFGALMIYASEPDAFDIEEKKLLLRLADNLAFGILSLHERGQRERMELSLREREQKYRVLYDENPSMFFTVDIQGIVSSVNEFGAKTLGYSVEELIGIEIRSICGIEQQDYFASQLELCLNNPDDIHHWEIQKLCKDGNAIWVRESARVVRDNDNEKKIFIVCEDITETRRLSEKLSYQATHDALTGLINRGEFENRLEDLLSTIQEDDRQHSLCYLDLDQFKVMNDTCGHIAGDELLRQLGTLLQSKTRKRDVIARLGGDEFAIIMEDCPINVAEEVVKKFMEAITEFQFFWERKSFKIGVSIGLVPINYTSGNLTSVLKKADSACYMAKDKGRNRIHIYHEDDQDIAQRQGQIAWVTRIQNALDTSQFELYLQPIVPLSVTEQEARRYEVLLRLKSKDGEMISPTAFLPAAERYNLSVKIDKWVIASLFELVNDSPEYQNGQYHFSINLSGHSIGNNELMEFALLELKHSNIPPYCICFEITETATIANLSSASLFIEKFKKQGCLFALDDFGSGLSSFAYLKNLSVDYLKIDGSFIKDINANPVNLAIVKSMNDIGQALGKHTVAEYVADNVILNILKDIGVDFIQGYHLGEPAPFIETLARGNAGNIVELASHR